MLEQLHVKNLALIDEEEIYFSSGLNILTGETGAGKSIILGALSLALGEKPPKDMLRDSNTEGLVELVFSITNDAQRAALDDMGITYDDSLIMTRKITEARSVAKINGEMVPANIMKQVGAIFIDIYGQKEGLSLLDKKKHLAMLDEYASDALVGPMADLQVAYAEYVSKKKEYEESSLDDEARAKEILFLEHEINEITSANISLGEDDELEEEYRRMNNASKIAESVNDAVNAVSAEGAASDMVSRALRNLMAVAEYDSSLSTYIDALTDVDSIMSDASRGLSDYMSDMNFDSARFLEIENRLNVLNSLKDKYGMSLDLVLTALDEKETRLEQLKSYDEYLSQLEMQLSKAESRVEFLCQTISDIRKNAAYELLPSVRAALADLNFMNVEFDMYFTKLDRYTANGFDQGEFIISTNPGEPMKPLANIASGGEMSRIMLALKTVLASKDSIDTLIFDEIDSGISGKTASAVAEKLAIVANDNKQVVCITHLAQVASMADAHYLIEKDLVGKKTISNIRLLSQEERVSELARILGGSCVTEATIANAKELLAFAKDFKK